MFPGTIRENIRIARSRATDAEVERAADEAAVLAFCGRLPDGLDTEVGERGYGLSGGEAQRIALARLFLRDADILLLDEPGAHLDADTERVLRDAVRRIAKGRTLVVVAHRPTFVEEVNRIIRIEDGRAIEVRRTTTDVRADADGSAFRGGAS